jgi:hypothetical protein
LRVGNWGQNGVIFSNTPQISDFLNISQSGCFAGFPETEKRAIGARNGLILPLEDYYPDRIPGICCQTISSVSYTHKGMMVSTQSTDTCSLEIENFAGSDNAKKNHNSPEWERYQ